VARAVMAAIAAMSLLLLAVVAVYPADDDDALSVVPNPASASTSLADVPMQVEAPDSCRLPVDYVVEDQPDNSVRGGDRSDEGYSVALPSPVLEPLVGPGHPTQSRRRGMDGDQLRARCSPQALQVFRS
jgi:hypothetical protein